MNFLALDIETANEDYSSICQIGLVEFNNGQIVDKWVTYIDPEDYFNPFNINIHGIDEETVNGAPTFPEIYMQLKQMVESNIIVHHMPFDRIALNRICEKYNLEPFNTNWLDSAKIVRRTWSEFAYKGYSLANISQFLKISFKHHDALEDALAAGKIVVKACETTGLTIEEWLNRIKKPISAEKQSSNLKIEGNPEGSLYGHTIVFTGSLSMTRREAAEIAAKLGCNVNNSVTKNTTIIVVGRQDVQKLAGHSKSTKHRKAEELIDRGYPIQIMSENDFIGIIHTLEENEKK